MLPIRCVLGGPQDSDDPGRPSPEIGQDLSDVVAADTEDSEDGIPDRAFQGASGETSVGFHMADFGFDGTAAAGVGDQFGCQAAPGSTDQNTGSVLAMAPIAVVDHSGIGALIGQDFDLFQRGAQGMTVVGISCKAAHADDEAPVQRGGHADLAAELMARPGLALGTAVDLRPVQGVDPVGRLGGLMQRLRGEGIRQSGQTGQLRCSYCGSVPGSARVGGVVEDRQHLVHGAHVAELLDDGFQRGTVFFIRQRGAGVGHHDHIEIQHHRVTGRGFATDVGLGSGDQQVGDAKAAAQPFQPRRAGDQRGITVLEDAQVSIRHMQFGPDLLPCAAWRQAFDGALAHLVGHEVVEKTAPVAAAAGGGHIGMGAPDHMPPRSAHTRIEPVDRAHDAARQGHLGGRAGLTEGVLHVDHHNGGLAWIQPVEQVQPAAPRHHAVDDVLPDCRLVHGVSSFVCRRTPAPRRSALHRPPGPRGSPPGRGFPKHAGPRVARRASLTSLANRLTMPAMLCGPTTTP